MVLYRATGDHVACQTDMLYHAIGDQVARQTDMRSYKHKQTDVPWLEKTNLESVLVDKIVMRHLRLLAAAQSFC